jgi:hypothetical protein
MKIKDFKIFELFFTFIIIHRNSQPLRICITNAALVLNWSVSIVLIKAYRGQL